MGENNQCIGICIGIVLGIGILLMVILLPMSFQGLDYYEFGFKRQKSTGTVKTDEVYTGGKYLVGPDYEFKTFPSTAHFIDLKPVSVFTYHKFAINVFVYFQYFLRKEDLPLLHEKYDVNYDYIIRKSAVAAIKREATKFETREYIEERSKVETALFRAVRERLSGLCCLKKCDWEYACPKNCIPLSKCNRETEKGLWVDVKYFQLGRVQVGKELQDRYLQKLILKENGAREKLRQKAQVVRKTTNAKVLAIENEAKEIRETAEAQSSLIKTVSQANYTVAVEKARSEGLRNLYKRLNIDKEGIKNSFDYMRTLRGLDNVHFTVDFQQRIVGSMP